MSKPPCKKCGHSEAEHAGDVSHPTTAPCWAGACTGNGCEHGCKDYQPDEAQNENNRIN